MTSPMRNLHSQRIKLILSVTKRWFMQRIRRGIISTIIWTSKTLATIPSQMAIYHVNETIRWPLCERSTRKFFRLTEHMKTWSWLKLAKRVGKGPWRRKNSKFNKISATGWVQYTIRARMSRFNNWARGTYNSMRTKSDLALKVPFLTALILWPSWIQNFHRNTIR